MSNSSTALRILRRFGPLALIALALFVFYRLGLNTTFGTRGLAAHFDTVMAWRSAHPAGSALAFFSLYVAIVAISVPASLWMSVPGGLLFGWFWGGALSWAASTLGASLAFLASRTAFEPGMAAKKANSYARFKAGFERNAFTYIIMLRLMPLPFFAVNMAAGAFHVKIRTFAAASAIGLLPASFLFAALGQSAADVLRTGGKLGMGLFRDPKIIAVFAGFALLSLLPLMLQRLRVIKKT